MESKSTNYLEDFHNAIRENDIATVQKLFYGENSRYFKYLINGRTNKSTALHLAIENKNADIVRFLLKRDARIDLKNEDGENCLELAAKLGEHDLVNLCLQSIGYIYDLTYPIECKITPLKCLTHSKKNYKVCDVFKFLLINGSDPDKSHTIDKIIRDKGPAWNDQELQVALIKLLLDHGADPNLQRYDNETSFESCFTFRNNDLIDSFISHGVYLYNNNFRLNALYLAVTHCMPKIVQKLIKMKMNVHKIVTASDPFYTTPLHLCFANTQGYTDQENCIETIRLLIKEGADVNALDGDHESPLYHAVISECLKAAQYLVSMGADVNGSEKRRPLFAAIYNRDLVMVEYLVSRGANMDFKTDYNNSISYYAIRYGHPADPEIMKFLIEKGMTLDEHEEDELKMKIDNLNRRTLILFKSFEQEIIIMKENKVCENCGTTYFDVLVKRRNALVNCLHFEEVCAVMKSDRYKDIFIYFYDRLKNNYLSGLKRMKIVDQLKEILLDVFPEDVITSIADFLSDQELKDIFERND